MEAWCPNSYRVSSFGLRGLWSVRIQGLFLVFARGGCDLPHGYFVSASLGHAAHDTM